MSLTRVNWYKHKKALILLCILFFVLVVTLSAYIISKRNRHLRFVEQMGNGINLGNTLDATNLRDYKPNAPALDYETFWGNPRIDSEQLAAIKTAGFKTVRIPVTFEDHLDKDNHISDIWMERVAEVIDMAIAEGLYVIMDLHGDAWLDLQTDKKYEVFSRFSAIWSQVAGRFKDYGEHLLFEGMNEPRLRDSDYEWKSGTPELRDFVNELNQLFVDTVRSAGGYNEERYLLICPYCNGPWDEAIEGLSIPDGNIIVAVHMYRPYRFCQDEDGTKEWNRDSHEDVFEAEASFKLMHDSCIKEKVPVIFTEYGCMDKDNIEERMEWAEFYMELSEKYQIPCIWWDNGSTYQLMDRYNASWKYPGLVEIVSGLK